MINVICAEVATLLTSLRDVYLVQATKAAVSVTPLETALAAKLALLL